MQSAYSTEWEKYPKKLEGEKPQILTIFWSWQENFLNYHFDLGFSDTEEYYASFLKRIQAQNVVQRLKLLSLLVLLPRDHALVNSSKKAMAAAL